MLDHKQRHDASRQLRAINYVVTQPSNFRPDFKAYLTDNWHVYHEFERRALQVAQRREHYSGYTLLEVMRHDSVVGELFGEYKINNSFCADLCRLFAKMNSECAGLFEFRARKIAA